MYDKKVLYFKATEDGKDIVVTEPVEENVYGKVLNAIVGCAGVPEGKYGVDYHMAYFENHGSVSSLTFEGKQDDMFYHLSFHSSDITEDIIIEKEHLKDLLIEKTWCFRLNWWMNNSTMTDDPGIKRENEVMQYDIHITDTIILRVIADSYKGYDDAINNMVGLVDRVASNEFKLEII